MIYWIWAAAAVAALWLYMRQTYSNFSSRGVKNEPIVPLFGHMLPMLLRQKHFVNDILKTYKTFPNERFVGRYEFMNPVVVVRDLDLVKKIAIKDFEYFLDHRSIIDANSDPLFGRNLFSLKGDEWRDMRSTLSPAFTSSKIKLMVPFMTEVGDQMVLSLKAKLKECGGEYLDVDCKDLTTRYANDVIASCAFGLKVDSHTDPNNQFYTNGKTASSFKFKQLIMFFLLASFPKIMRRMKLSLFSESVKSFFRSLVQDTMQDRETRHIIRPDMIHLLMEAKKGKLSYDEKSVDTDAGFATVEESSVGKKNVQRVWSDDDLTAQAVLFFIAGFETVSSAMSFMMYELACNPDAQVKLAREIKDYDQKNGGKVDFSSIQQMTYMDMVVSEVLRLWPPAVALDRGCNKDYNMGKPNKESKEDYIMRKGEGLNIPVWAFHRDPQFFPDPDKFDAERFSDDNKHKIQPFAYMPFGLGPRNCIGSRFALCEVKVIAYMLLKHFEVSPGEKTLIPAQLDNETFNLKIKGGHWVRFKLRH